MGFEVEVRNVGWEPAFSLVTTGELDLGAAAITITEDRKKNYDFTDPYYEAKLLMVVKEDSKIASFDELKDKKVSVQITTTGHLAMQELQGKGSSNILAYENLPIAIQEVINGTTDAALGDNAVVLEYIKNNPDAGIHRIGDALCYIEVGQEVLTEILLRLYSFHILSLYYIFCKNTIIF